MSLLDPIMQKLLECYSESHSNFSKKMLPFFVKNPEFFVCLSLKKNEDIHRTKASHTRMNPKHVIFVQKECSELLQ